MNLFYGDQLYSDTPKLFKSLELSSASVGIYPIPLVHQDDFKLPVNEEKPAGKINVLFVESCSNPSDLILSNDVVKRLRNMSSLSTTPGSRSSSSIRPLTSLSLRPMW